MVKVPREAMFVELRDNINVINNVMKVTSRVMETLIYFDVIKNFKILSFDMS